MYGTRNRSPAEMDMVDVLKAISRTSARLARNLTILEACRNDKRGDKENETQRNHQQR